jgi:hypothetical protein
MADVTLEQISALLDEKLRPIKAKLDAHSKLLDRLSEPPDAIAAKFRPPRSKRMFLALASTAVIVLAVVLVGRTVLGPSDGSSAQSSGSRSGRLLYADDFSNAATGLFLDAQRGAAALPIDRASAQWDYAYRDGALVAHVGPPSLPLSGRVIGGAARAANRLTGDFAFEVKAKASAPAASAVYGLRYYPGNREFGFGIQPGPKSYQLWEIFQSPLLSARSFAIAPDDMENVLRLEVRGSNLGLFVNGQAIDARQDEAFGARPASIGLFFDTTGTPAGAAVEIRYTDFKVYSLNA